MVPDASRADQRLEKQLLDHVEEAFSQGKKSEAGSDVKEPHARIGQLAVENDFITRARARGRVERKEMIDRVANCRCVFKVRSSSCRDRACITSRFEQRRRS